MNNPAVELRKMPEELFIPGPHFYDGSYDALGWLWLKSNRLMPTREIASKYYGLTNKEILDLNTCLTLQEAKDIIYKIVVSDTNRWPIIEEVIQEV